MLPEVLHRDKQHPKTFTVFLAKVLVVHLVCPADSTRVTIVDVAEQLEPLVDKNVMNDEVGKAIGENSQPDSEPDFENSILPQQEKPDAYDCIDNKKRVVALKPGIVVLAVMVGVQGPEKTVHDVFVRKPGNPFPENKGANRDEGTQYDLREGHHTGLVKPGWYRMQVD